MSNYPYVLFLVSSFVMVASGIIAVVVYVEAKILENKYLKQKSAWE